MRFATPSFVPSAGVHIGISGWNYAGWRGLFYPPGLPHKDELAFASRNVDSIEINGSFYSLLRPNSVERWRDETPDDFIFALKGSRFITHMKRLSNVAAALANFYASGLLAFGSKLGPILWQLPPSFAFDAARLSAFFTCLPRTTSEAARLAKRHDERLTGRAYTRASLDLPLRYALEVRHPSFHDPDFFALLREYRVALCIADSAKRYPDFDEVTADFVYVRLHGATKLYASGYARRTLERWAARIGQWRERADTRDVFVYFDNDAKVRAPFDARTLMDMVHGARTTTEPERFESPGRRASPSLSKARPRSRAKAFPIR
jgi:uncharacterized protein YecE (DUF72 family)